MKTEKRFIALLWIGLLTIATSCEEIFLKEVEVDNGVIENRLVVQSFISPQDTLIKVKVRFAEHAIGVVSKNKESGDVVTNAIVTLFGGGKMITLSYDERTDYYIVSADNFPIIAGNTYHLEVSVTDYLSTKATCAVPKYKVDTSKVEVVHEEGAANQVVLRWEDDSDDTNYYSLSYLSMSDDSLGKTVLGFSYGLGIYTNDSNAGSRVESNRFRLEDVHYYSGFKSYPLVLFANTDYHYYEFHRTLEEQTTDIEIPSGIPLSVYTNIEGGFGVFAAYNGVLFAFD